MEEKGEPFLCLRRARDRDKKLNEPAFFKAPILPGARRPGFVKIVPRAIVWLRDERHRTTDCPAVPNCAGELNLTYPPRGCQASDRS